MSRFNLDGRDSLAGLDRWITGSDPEEREAPCPSCGSEGFIEHGHPNAPHADWVEECGECRGTGRVVVPVVPVTLDDLAAEDDENAQLQYETEMGQ